MDEFHLGKSRKYLRALQALPRLFFGLFYHSFAGKYDLVTRVLSMGLWKTWLSITTSYLDGTTILELGSGPGHLQSLLKDNGIKGIGLDESQQMAKLARDRLEKAGHTPNLIRAIGEVIPFQDSTFDLVVTSFPAEFITSQYTLAEVDRVLKDDGYLVILRFAWLSFRQWPHKMITYLFRLVGEAPDPKQPLQLKRLSTPFIKAGFSVEIVQIELESSGMILLLCRKNNGKTPTHTVTQLDSKEKPDTPYLEN